MHKPNKIAAAAMLAFLLQACGTQVSQPDATSADATSPDASADAALAQPAPQTDAEPASPDWSGLDDTTVQAMIDQKLEAFYAKHQQRFGFLTVESLEGGDHFTAAGIAASSLGMPAIVVSRQQREIHLVGDEALAYFQDDRLRIGNEAGAYFDRGEYAEGIDHILAGIVQTWNGG